MKIKAIVIAWPKEGSAPTVKTFDSVKAARAEYPTADAVHDAQLWTAGDGCIKRKPLPPKAKAEAEKAQDPAPKAKSEK